MICFLTAAGAGLAFGAYLLESVLDLWVLSTAAFQPWRHSQARICAPKNQHVPNVIGFVPSPVILRIITLFFSARMPCCASINGTGMKRLLFRFRSRFTPGGLLAAHERYL